jgi:hypothetical protein
MKGTTNNNSYVRQYCCEVVNINLRPAVRVLGVRLSAWLVCLLDPPKIQLWCPSPFPCLPIAGDPYRYDGQTQQKIFCVAPRMDLFAHFLFSLQLFAMNNLLFLLLLMPTASAVAAEQSPYLKEILEGRCYYAPPTREASAPELCPLVVGSFMNLLESHLDADISVPDFDPYLEKADFSSPQDKALLYLHFFGDSSSPFVTPPGFVSPEDTPGGALLRNLVFCGVDQRGNCSVEKSKAYWTFWEAGKFCSTSRLEEAMAAELR